jgi:hypothetical protein
MKGYEHAKETLQTVFDTAYVDLATKAVFIDTTIYNPDVPGFFYVRLVIELGVTGGASSSVDMYFFRPYHFFSKYGYALDGTEGFEELVNEIMLIFCHLYYLWFLYTEVLELFNEEIASLNLFVGTIPKFKHTHKSILGDVICVEDIAKVVNVEVKSGDKIEEGERLCQILRVRPGGEKPKAVSLYAPCSGTISIMHKKNGDTLLNGSVILSMSVTNTDSEAVNPGKRPRFYSWAFQIVSCLFCKSTEDMERNTGKLTEHIPQWTRLEKAIHWFVILFRQTMCHFSSWVNVFDALNIALYFAQITILIYSQTGLHVELKVCSLLCMVCASL